MIKTPSAPKAEESPQKFEHERSPLLFGERARVRGKCGSDGHSVHLMFLAFLSRQNP